MNPIAFKNWLGQSTTGQGWAMLSLAVTGWTSGHLTASAAAVTAVPAVVLIIWPQKTAVAAQVGVAASDIEALIPALNVGMKLHAMMGTTPAPAPVPAPALAPVPAVATTPAV